MSTPIPLRGVTQDEYEEASMLLGVNATAADMQTAIRQIRVQKADGRAILPSRRDTALKRLDDFESELGRLKRLATELRADILALTVE